MLNYPRNPEITIQECNTFRPTSIQQYFPPNQGVCIQPNRGADFGRSPPEMGVGGGIINSYKLEFFKYDKNKLWNNRQLFFSDKYNNYSHRMPKVVKTFAGWIYSPRIVNR